jgi:hypothetical protein
VTSASEWQLIPEVAQAAGEQTLVWTAPAASAVAYSAGFDFATELAVVGEFADAAAGVCPCLAAVVAVAAADAAGALALAGGAVAVAIVVERSAAAAGADVARDVAVESVGPEAAAVVVRVADDAVVAAVAEAAVAAGVDATVVAPESGDDGAEPEGVAGVAAAAAVVVAVAAVEYGDRDAEIGEADGGYVERDLDGFGDQDESGETHVAVAGVKAESHVEHVGPWSQETS